LSTNTRADRETERERDSVTVALIALLYSELFTAFYPATALNALSVSPAVCTIQHRQLQVSPRRYCPVVCFRGYK